MLRRKKILLVPVTWRTSALVFAVHHLTVLATVPSWLNCNVFHSAFHNKACKACFACVRTLVSSRKSLAYTAYNILLCYSIHQLSRSQTTTIHQSSPGKSSNHGSKVNMSLWETQAMPRQEWSLMICIWLAQNATSTFFGPPLPMLSVSPELRSVQSITDAL